MDCCRGIAAYLRFGSGWGRSGAGDGPLRRLVGVTSVHTRLRSLHLLRLLESRPMPAEVLEVGFGEGYLLLTLARRHPETRFEGWEVDAACAAAARDRATACGLDNVTFALRDFRRVDPTPRFGLIYAADVLEHVEDDAGLLRVLAAMLLPGGLLALHVPRRRSLQCRFFSKFRSHFHPGHVREEYTDGQLCALAAEAGLVPGKPLATFGPWGELAFELNTLGWPHPVRERLTRLASLPLVLPLALLDLLPRPWGNSILLTARKQGGA